MLLKLVITILITSSFSFWSPAQTIQIGSGTATLNGGTAIPVTNYDYTYSQQIVSATEYAAQGGIPGIISKIRYKFTAIGTPSVYSNWEVYIGNTTRTVFSSTTDWESINSLTQVFNGPIPTPINNQWFELTFSTSFNYTGDNIIIAVYEKTPGWLGSPTIQSYTSTTGSGIMFRQDGSVIDINTPPTATGTYSSIAQLQFEGTMASCSGIPIGGTTVLSATSGNIGSTINGSVTGGSNVSGLTYQWQYSDDNGVTWIDIVGQTNSTLTTTAMNTLGTRQYRRTITCTATSDMAISSPVTYTTTLIYCAVSNDGTSCITNVSLNTINNTTSGCSGGTNYSLQTATTDLQQGVLYPFTITTDGAAISSVWFDWNQNGTFEVSEWYQVYTNATTGTITVNVPATAILGNTRMRIRSRNSGNVNDATSSCLNMGSGETEDYIINILPPPSCPQPSALTTLNASNTDASISWTAGGAETSWQVQYGSVGFTLGTGFSVIANSNSYLLTSLTSNSFYQVYVRAICGPGDTSLWTGPLLFNTYNQGIYMDWSSNCPTAGFIDISTTGTALNLTEDGEVGFTLPFPILYQGVLINNCTVGNNGGMALGTTTAQIGYGGNMTTLAGNFIFPWGDDMAPGPNGNVYHQVIGNAPNRTFIVQWHELSNYNTPPTVTFQVQFDEATHKIWFVYDDVVFGAPNAADDYAANADIGVSGPNQDLNVSNDNATYLQNNSCVEFYYTDCPKPRNFVTTFLGVDEIQFSWTAGLSNETEWTIEYGPVGFTPGTGTILNETTNSSVISGLTQLTDYTIYIYANCANGDVSLALIKHFTTLPYCASPTTIGGTTSPDSLKVTWNWTPSPLLIPVTGFNIQYGMTGFDLYSNEATIVPANGTNNADTVFDATLMGSGVYQIYVQAVCLGGDTSAFAGPFTVVMPLTNDIVCSQEALQLNQTYTFNNNGATVSTNESSIAPPATGAQTIDGWINSTLNGTLWYTFTAPPSGNVRIDATAIGYDGQAAVYNATNCADFNTFTLMGANDNAVGGTSLAPNFTVCGLTPGTTYYLMFDKFNTTSGNFSINIASVSVEAGTANPVTNTCYGTVVDLNTTISTSNTTGTWSSSIPAVNVSIDGADFSTTGLAYQTFNFEYRVVNGCAYDSIISQVKIFPPSNAGEDGVITACKNEPVDLLAGLNGNADLNGTWYNPSNNVMPNSQYTTAAFVGQYNFKYISGNGVCPNDTANVVVTVGSCDWLSIEESLLEEISIYPNPSTGIVNIVVPSSNDLKLEVSDINGRIVQTIDQPIKSGTNIINLKEVERGTYFFKLINGEASKVFHVVIQ